MKRTYLIVAALAAYSALFSGCKKDNQPPGPDPNHPGCSVMWAHQERFPGLQSQPQTFSITAGVNQSITAAGGTKFNFYPNSFKDQNGNIITSGTVTVSLVEALTPGNMVANRTTTYYKGNMLETGGQVAIEATMNGIELTANTYSIAFKQSASSEKSMTIYYGTMNNPDSSANWKSYDSSAAGSAAHTTVEKINNDAGGGATADYYRFNNCTSFGYVAAGRLGSSATLTNVNVVISNSDFSIQNTEVYVVSRSTNSAMMCYLYDYSTHTFNMANPYEGTTGQVPVGAVVDIVAIAYRNDHYYYSHLPGVTVTSGMTVNLTMVNQAESYVKSDLAGF